ncbi:NYN domain-containing protein [Gemmiger sp.]|uniref:NYN domain-containing protein n=1 Tax=Gemmiger sp. TaxID=2049027 RepID=UPI003AB727B6
MKRLVIGLLAHVDSGKTTLAEGLLYRAGVLRKLGRVDHRDAFLDTDSQERARGITIFAKQSVLTLPAADGCGETALTLLDTPGHVDFSAEAERALQVLDYAVLVVSGTDGVQAHTETLWKLLARYRVPTFVFVNKMDLPGADAAVRLRELRGRFGDGCVDFSAAPDPEALALCSEPLMNEVLDTGTPAPETVITAIARRQVFPVFFGAALRLDGLDGLLRGLQTLTRTPPQWPEFGARVFKISEDAGTRLTWLKVTGGVLHVKDVLPGGEKADALRLYNGGKFRLVSEAFPGMVVAVAGPAATRPGQGLGAESDAETPLLEPVLNYRIDCDADAHTVLKAMQTLEDEDPQLHVNWRDDLGEVHVQLMGEVQLEILQNILQDRFGLDVTFSEGGILYKETLTTAVEGIGHYEPLRHYAEVHLLLEPGARGSGVQLAADCPPDTLAENWQRLILTHLAERTHPGVLIGAPLTDVKITLAAGRAHQKHTEGGDFRQATYRAVRQGLRMAAAKDGVALLEPWYDFTLELPADALGRAMADVQRMCGSFEAPETLPKSENTVRLTGRLPVATARGYAREVAAYTHGLGRWAVLPAGYDTCHNADEVLAAVGYDPDADTENPADSVFCAHGAGYLVKWDEVPARAHVSSGLERRLNGTPAADEDAAGQADANDRRRRAAAYRGTLEQDKELLAIFERTYGKIRRRGETGDAKKAARAALHTAPAAASVPAKPVPTGPDYLLVDGYNVIFAWDDLRRLADGNLDAARRRLMDILCNYAGYKRCVPILVFDAYKVRGGTREVEQYHNLYVVYTREAETADMYIERATHELAKEHRTRVVSSDGAEQIIVMGHGALRVSARAFEEEVRAVEKEIREFLEE